MPLLAVACVTCGHISLAKGSHVTRPDTDGPRNGPDYGQWMGRGDVEAETAIQFSSVAQSCLTLCDPMDSSMPGFPLLHYLPEFAQIHVH